MPPSRTQPVYGLPTGVGAISHQYLGYNVIGGSYETMTVQGTIAKRVNVPTPGILTSIGAYVKGNDVPGMSAVLYSDHAGEVGLIIGVTHFTPTNLLFVNSDGSTQPARWLHFPIGMYLTPGNYWIAVFNHQGTTEAFQIAYDATGSDRKWNSGHNWVNDQYPTQVYSYSTSSNQYSLRADFLVTG